VTRVVWTAAVPRCGKQIEILPHYYFSWIVSFQNRDTHARCFLWRQNNPEVNYSNIRISGVGGEMFPGEISSSMSHYKILVLNNNYWISLNGEPKSFELFGIPGIRCGLSSLFTVLSLSTHYGVARACGRVGCISYVFIRRRYTSSTVV
jgi:hypothetical protein